MAEHFENASEYLQQKQHNVTKQKRRGGCRQGCALRQQLVADDANLPNGRRDELIDLGHSCITRGNHYRTHPLHADPFDDLAVPIERERGGTHYQCFGRAGVTERTLSYQSVGDGERVSSLAQSHVVG